MVFIEQAARVRAARTRRYQAFRLALEAAPALDVLPYPTDGRARVQLELQGGAALPESALRRPAAPRPPAVENPPGGQTRVRVVGLSHTAWHQPPVEPATRHGAVREKQVLDA